MSDRIEQEFEGTIDPYELHWPGDGVRLGSQLVQRDVGGKTIKCRPLHQRGDPVWWVGELPPYDGTNPYAHPYVVEAVVCVQFLGPLDGRPGRLHVYYQVRSVDHGTVGQASDHVLRPRQVVEIGVKVRMPVCLPELPIAGHEALVIDQDGDDWVLSLDCDPDPPDCDNTMLWPITDQDMLEVVR